MNHLKSLSLCLSILGLLACAPKAATIEAQPVYTPPVPQVIPPDDQKPAPQTFSWVTEDGGQSQLDFNPQVDILFVTDNSDSMRSAQENLSRNIDGFAAGITQNPMIDYHIGVVSVWDSSKRFADNKKDPYQIGDLHYIRDKNGKSVNKRYVTKADRTKISLASTIDIGVTPFEQGGPEKEEFFSPLSAALDKNGHGATNEGFFRDNAQLVVILMTDADDSSERLITDKDYSVPRLGPEQMAQKLIAMKGGNAAKLSVYGVLVRKSDPDDKKDWDLRIHPKYHPECFDMTKKNPTLNGSCTTGFGPDRLEDFIFKANGVSAITAAVRQKYLMGITSSHFGDDLSRIGDDIKIKTLEKQIFLSQRPKTDDKTQQIMIRVRYGTADQLAKGTAQVIPQKQDGGWLYDPENNAVNLSGNIKYNYVDGARFSVDLMPLTLK